MTELNYLCPRCDNLGQYGGEKRKYFACSKCKCNLNYDETVKIDKVLRCLRKHIKVESNELKGKIRTVFFLFLPYESIRESRKKINDVPEGYKIESCAPDESDIKYDPAVLSAHCRFAFYECNVEEESRLDNIYVELLLKDAFKYLYLSLDRGYFEDTINASKREHKTMKDYIKKIPIYELRSYFAKKLDIYEYIEIMNSLEYKHIHRPKIFDKK